LQRNKVRPAVEMFAMLHGVDSGRLLEAIAAHARAHGGGTVRWITAADNERAQRVYDRLATRATWVTYEWEV
jgi:uncharacterized pyridoxal phosphate-containing UPF0001 family protein